MRYLKTRCYWCKDASVLIFCLRSLVTGQRLRVVSRTVQVILILIIKKRPEDVKLDTSSKDGGKYEKKSQVFNNFWDKNHRVSLSVYLRP